MDFEQQLYQTVLILAGIANVSMALALLHGNISYRDYRVYLVARRLVALGLTIFAIGFFMHAHFQWRYTCPAAASALSVSYFHAGGMLFGWSHTSLLNPTYLTKKVVIRDLLILFSGITAYWTAVAYGVNYSPTGALLVLHLSFIIFFGHVLLITYTFYRTYYRVRHSLQKLSLGTIGQFVRWMLLSCHLIIGFGIASIAITACLPNNVLSYTVLLSVGILVFVYIFFSINDYGWIIDSATNATEDIRGQYLSSGLNRTTILQHPSSESLHDGSCR